MNLAMNTCQKQGRVVLKRAYSDSDHLSSKLRRAIADSGMGLVEMPKEHVQGTPNTNMQIIVDAMETAISKPLIKHFVFVAEDCNLRPLMLKLRQLGCFATIMVMSETTGDKLKPCVDEVIMLHTLLQVDVPMASLPYHRPCLLPMPRHARLFTDDFQHMPRHAHLFRRASANR